MRSNLTGKFKRKSSDKMPFHLENMPSKNKKCLLHFISQLKNMKYIFQPKKYLHSNFKRSKKHLPLKTLHLCGLKNVCSLNSFISFELNTYMLECVITNTNRCVVTFIKICSFFLQEK